MVKISLDKNSPNTNAFLGAVLSGGDVEKLAQLYAQTSEEVEENEPPEDLRLRPDEIPMIVGELEF